MINNEEIMQVVIHNLTNQQQNTHTDLIVSVCFYLCKQ